MSVGNPKAEKESWMYSKLSFVAGLISIFITGWFAWNANNLAAASVRLAERADSNSSQIDALRQLIKSQDTAVRRQDTLIAKYDSQLAQFKTLISSSQDIDKQLLVQGGNMRKQLRFTEKQDSETLYNRKLDLKIDSIQLTNAFDSIALARKKFTVGFVNRGEYNFFESIGIGPTVSYLSTFNKVIDDQMNNRFLLANDSLFAHWRNMRAWNQAFILFLLYADDDPPEAGHFRTYRPFNIGKQNQFYELYSRFIEINNRIFHRNYLPNR